VIGSSRENLRRRRIQRLSPGETDLRRDTELVVLSACETGLRQVKVGERIFGLRRAFVLAGAKTLVISLWKVPDDRPRELMEDFYRGLLVGRSRADARGAARDE
jgi:CHAT domain-containing protein